MTEELGKYNQKRNFERTAEPEGTARAEEPEQLPEHAGGGLRFVIQHHLARRDHYDLRLEWEGVLLSWAIPKGPSYDTHDKRLAVRVEDHPFEYRNFEGTIPKGEYGGGIVMLWDEGFWEPRTDVEEGLGKGDLKLILKGRRLRGKWALVRWKAKSEETKDNWLLLKEKDEYVKSSDGISEYTTSIRSGRTMEEIERGEDEKVIRNPFDTADVQLAKLVDTIPEGEDWLYELKYDGFRIMAFAEGSSVRLMTRNGNDYSSRFHDIADTLIDFAGGRAMVLDGEMTVTDEEGRTDFQALQSYLKNPGDKKLTYIVFDLLALDGADLRERPLSKRKEMLEALMKGAPASLYYSRHVRGGGKESFAAACEAGMEGIVGKRADSIYSGTRNGDWIKLKCEERQEFVIGGYSLSDKRTGGVSSLLLGVYEEGELVYAGRSGTGFSDADRVMLEEKFKNLKKMEPPFRLAPKPVSAEKFTWLEPALVAEIKFAEWTKDNLLRQASFKGIRTDKNPRDVKREKAQESNQEAGKTRPVSESDREVVKTQSALESDREAVKTQSALESDREAVKTQSALESDRKEVKTRPIQESDQKAVKTQLSVSDRETDKVRDLASNGDERKLQLQATGGNMEKSMELNSDGLLIEGIKITNPDKVIFTDPEITKADIVRYYEKVSERMLPYVSHRILSIVRCPKGISQTCFYKKHPGPGSRGIVTIPVTDGDGGTEEYFYIEDAYGLISEAQMGTLEFHTWGSRVDELEKPDMMVFDLDPDEGMELDRVRQGVRDVRSILSELSLNSYLKTSGGKGYHVVVPLKPVASWEVFHDFAKGIAGVMEQKWPDRYTSNVRKSKRTDKIFIDWIRNGRGATSVAPYSIRARKGARVSMPIAWSELDMVAPDGIRMEDALMRISDSDPWADFFQNDQRIK